MEEADLRKERLQAITDKRRIQEDISKKRRQIEEDKLKLQYIKKKALREQWLMDGLSQQTEKEQEAMRLQAQDEQQQSDELQSNILRIENEIQDLEAEELSISTNEEAILKQLQEVERTTEDIIKELSAEYHSDFTPGTYHVPSPLPDCPSIIPVTPAYTLPLCKSESEEKKKATFAFEINVEHGKKTGQNQVVSMSSVTPETVLGRGLKVYDDGRKSVYALQSDGDNLSSGAVGEMTPEEVQELLRQASEKQFPTEVQYHQPVYSAAYAGNPKPSAPMLPNKRERNTLTLSPCQSVVPSKNGAGVLAVEDEHRKQGNKLLLHTSKEETKLPYFSVPGKLTNNKLAIPDNDLGMKVSGLLTNSLTNLRNTNPAEVTVWSEERPALKQPEYPSAAHHSYSPVGQRFESDPDTMHKSAGDSNHHSPFCADSVTSLNLMNSLPEELEATPITMVFMGYENASDDDEEEIYAELIIIQNSDEEDSEGQYITEDNVRGLEILMYHPEGYKSQIFQPRTGTTEVTGCGDTCTHWDDVKLHRPTFIHKSVKKSAEGRGPDEPANTGSSNTERLKLCSTQR